MFRHAFAGSAGLVLLALFGKDVVKEPAKPATLPGLFFLSRDPGQGISVFCSRIRRLISVDRDEVDLRLFELLLVSWFGSWLCDHSRPPNS